MSISKKAIYKNTIIKELYFSQPMSVADMCNKMKKSVSLIFGFMSEMHADGIIVESGYAASKGGRRALTYSLQPDIYYSVAVAVDQLLTRIAIIDMQNNIIGEIAEINLPLINNNIALQTITDAINNKINESGIAKQNFLGVGVTMPGFVDVDKGINYSYLDNKGKSLVKYWSEKIQLPITIDNDSSAIALAEAKFGKGKEHKNVMVANIGWGIGLGIIINHQIFRGDSGFAGELSHLPLFSSSRLCICGKTGCLETEAALTIIVEKARAGLKSGAVSALQDTLPQEVDFERDCEMIFNAALNGDIFAVELLTDAGYSIGKGLAVLIHLFNPKLIVLSGRGAAVGKIWEGAIWQALNKFAIPRLVIDTKVETSSLGMDASLIGTALLVVENFVNTHKN